MNDEHKICPQQHPYRQFLSALFFLEKCPSEPGPPNFSKLPTPLHIGFLLIVFSRIKDIQLLGLNHYAYVT
jgi:hypothetical protein